MRADPLWLFRSARWRDRKRQVLRLGSFSTRELQVMYVCVRNRVSLAAVGAGLVSRCMPTFFLCSFRLRRSPPHPPAANPNSTPLLYFTNIYTELSLTCMLLSPLMTPTRASARNAELYMYPLVSIQHYRHTISTAQHACRHATLQHEMLAKVCLLQSYASIHSLSIIHVPPWLHSSGGAELTGLPL
jgi:hypothetical protein